MIRNIPSCIKELSGNDFDVFEEIISHKYKKFMSFYRLVENVSDLVKSLHYNFTSDENLDVDITFGKNVDIATIEMELNNNINSSKYECDIAVNNHTISISISLVE